ncbi:right-handed parallel beta-helix repeat-containing protein [Opitutaceae bacterium TAV4]|nr:right-handed parallel beta-helix repeat-containing protein [Opitutaceae bacterium TAV4]RRJ98393.1 right-handed parallel beta-helix repeat-containing protein [Opitutaceae bacterium TAV3]
MKHPPRYVAVIFAFASLLALTAAATTGPLPADIAAWTDAIKQQQRDAGKRLLAQIAADVADGKKDIRIPAAHYRFAETTGERYPTHILLPKNMDGVTLDFQGSTLWFETESSGIVLSNARNTTLRNVYLDWDPLPFIQGTVTAIQPNDGTFDVKLDPGYERAVPGLMKDPWRGRGIVFDPTTRELKAGQLGCEVTFSWSARQPDGSHRLKFHGFNNAPIAESGIAVGDPYAMLRRMQRAVRMEGTDNCTLEDVTLYASPFVAFVHSAGGAPTFRRCNILRRPGTNRLMAGNADGINCDNMTKGPLIEDCRMETLGDDFVNVHGHLARVIWQEAPDQIVITVPNRRGKMDTPRTVEFLERATMRSLGKRQATWTSTRWKLERDRCLADLKHQWHSGAASALSTASIGKTLPASRLKLDRPIEITGDVIMLCEELSSPGTIIRGNDFKGSLARGLRLQSPHVLVENNKLSITQGNAITLNGHAAYWGEGPYVYDAIIRNNTIDDTSRAGRVSGGHRASILVREGSDYATTRLPRDIRIEQNTITRSGGSAIVVRGVDNLAITGNTIIGYGQFPPSPPIKGQEQPTGVGAAIVVDSIKGLTLDKNTITTPGPGASGDPVVKIDIQP